MKDFTYIICNVKDFTYIICNVKDFTYIICNVKDFTYIICNVKDFTYNICNVPQIIFVPVISEEIFSTFFPFNYIWLSNLLTFIVPDEGFSRSVVSLLN